MTDLIPTPRPVPSPEDRMAAARTDTPPTTDPAPTHPGRSFRTWMSDTDRDQLDARAACAEAERDDALDARDVVRAQLQDALWTAGRHATTAASLRKQLDDMTATAAGFADERDQARQTADFRQGVIDRHRQELGAAGEVLAVVRDAAERIDRALAVYDTTPGEPEPEHYAYPDGTCAPDCPGCSTPPSSVPPRRAQEQPACTCYPSGFSPGTYEGPMRDCPVHGELSAEARP